MSSLLKRIDIRLTITNPTGEIAYDQLIRPGEMATVTFQESINGETAEILLKGKKEIILTRTFKLRIRKV